MHDLETFFVFNLFQEERSQFHSFIQPSSRMDRHHVGLFLMESFLTQRWWHGASPRFLIEAERLIYKKKRAGGFHHHRALLLFSACGGCPGIIGSGDMEDIMVSSSSILTANIAYPTRSSLSSNILGSQHGLLEDGLVGDACLLIWPPTPPRSYQCPSEYGGGGGSDHGCGHGEEFGSCHWLFRFQQKKI